MDWNWNMITAIATAFYSAMFTFALIATFLHLRELEKSRRFQATLAVFRELKSKDFIYNRRYIYDFLPEGIEGVDGNQLKDYFLEVEVALAAFDRVGYLLREKHIDAEPILENYWAQGVWVSYQISFRSQKMRRFQGATRRFISNADKPTKS